MNKQQKMYQEIEAHGANLNRIFHTQYNNIDLCKKLRRIEHKAHHATTCLCNTNTLNLLELNQYTGYDVEQATDEEQDIFFDRIKTEVLKVLGEKARNVFFINYDPRGYALKLRLEFCEGKQIYKDWGGYGIIAPDFSI